MLVKENLMFNIIGMYANLVKSLRMIKPGFEILKKQDNL